MRLERRAEEPRNGAREGTEAGAIRGLESRAATTTVTKRGSADRQKRCSRGEPGAERPGRTLRTFGKRAMYASLMEEVVREENRDRALVAVKGNQGAPGVDHMRTTELESHLQAHWERVRAKLLAGTWVPSPVKRVEIPKPSGGTRMLGIPTVMDRLIQQMLLQALTPIFAPDLQRA